MPKSAKPSEQDNARQYF